MECGQAVRMGRPAWGRRDEGGGFAGARERFVGVRATCVGAPASFVGGTANDVDGPTYDHDSFGSNVGAST